MKKKSFQIISLFLVALFVGDKCFAASSGGGLYTVISNLTNIIFSFVGGLALLAILIGGITWMTAGGDTRQIDVAKAIIKAAVMGLIVSLAAAAIVNQVSDLGK
ncbi:hypothetical protein M0R01_03485 [bacterium]|nr:hypothetical protein [bacterium]